MPFFVNKKKSTPGGVTPKIADVPIVPATIERRGAFEKIVPPPVPRDGRKPPFVDPKAPRPKS